VRIGAHVPTRGGLLSAIRNARECGADAIQVFISNPRAWAPPRISAKEASTFGSAWSDSGLGPLYVHSTYVVNLASPMPEFHTPSIAVVPRSGSVASRIGASGYVEHAGYGGPGEQMEAFERASEALRATTSSGGCAILVELTAGTAGSVAATFPEAARLFEAVGHAGLGLCADTCHLFAAGYALDEPDGVAGCFEELRSTGLAERLTLIHANDAKYERGSHRDRHEHIGQGRIGVEGFYEILRRPEVRDLSFVIETPGTLSDHARNIATLRRLAADRPTG